MDQSDEAAHDARQIVEVAEIRLALERLALSLVIDQHTDASLELARALLDELNQANELADIMRAHTRFHLAIYAPCDRQSLLKLIERQMGLAEQALRVEASQFPFIGDEDRIEHSRLLDLVSQRDGQNAKALLKEHILVAAQDLSNWIENENHERTKRPVKE